MSKLRVFIKMKEEEERKKKKIKARENEEERIKGRVYVHNFAEQGIRILAHLNLAVPSVSILVENENEGKSPAVGLNQELRR